MELINKDLISRSLATDYLITKANAPGSYGYISTKEIYDYLSELPSAEPERPKGEWIATYSDCGGDPFVWVSWKCSNCGYVRKKGWKYTDDGKKPDALFCEMCKADMRGNKNG